MDSFNENTLNVFFLIFHILFLREPAEFPARKKHKNNTIYIYMFFQRAEISWSPVQFIIMTRVLT